MGFIQVVARVVAVMVAIRKRRKLLDDERQDRAATDADRRDRRPRVVKSKQSVEPKASRVGLTKPAAPRSKKISRVAATRGPFPPWRSYAWAKGWPTHTRSPRHPVARVG